MEYMAFDRILYFEKKLSIKLITVEARVMLMCVDGPKSAGELYENSSCSYATFYNTLKRMADTGLVCYEVSAEDKRVKVYSIGPSALDALKELRASLAETRFTTPKIAVVR
jgi:DNA-binding MarR family transcriptional regulator